MERNPRRAARRPLTRSQPLASPQPIVHWQASASTARAPAAAPAHVNLSARPSCMRRAAVGPPPRSRKRSGHAATECRKRACCALTRRRRMSLPVAPATCRSAQQAAPAPGGGGRPALDVGTTLGRAEGSCFRLRLHHDGDACQRAERRVPLAPKFNGPDAGPHRDWPLRFQVTGRRR